MSSPLAECTITGSWPETDGSVATGRYLVTPVYEALGDGVLVPVTSTPVALDGMGTGTRTLKYISGQTQWQITEQVDGADNPPAYVVTPTGSTLDLSTAARSTPATAPVATYVLSSSVGHPGGPAGPLQEDGTLPTDQLPGGTGGAVLLWQVAEAHAGLVDEAAITDYQPGMSLDIPISLPPGTYVSKRFVCSSLIYNPSNTKLYNCDITGGNANFTIRLDEDGGTATGRYLEHCRITGLGVALAGAGYKARLCEVINNGDDAARVGRAYADPTVFELCRFHNFRPVAGAHCDGIQVVTPLCTDLFVWGCSITMNTAPGYTLPTDPPTGYTGALFYDGPGDVPIPPDDPQPKRIGTAWVYGSKLMSSQDYTLVMAGGFTDFTDCTMIPGTTALENFTSPAVVTGKGNTLTDGSPLVDTDIAGDLRSRYLAEGDPRVLASLPDGTVSGQTPLWDGTDWTIDTPAGGGGGIPADTVTTKGDLLVATGPGVVVRLPVGGTDGNALVVDSGTSIGLAYEPVGGGGGGTSAVKAFSGAVFTSGVIDPPPDSGGVWATLKQVDGTSLFSRTVPAVVGDLLTVGINDMFKATDSNTHVDLGVIVAGEIVRYLATMTGTPGAEGDPGQYPNATDFKYHPAQAEWLAEAGDIDGGDVTVAVVHKGGTGVFYASTDYPARMSMKNLGTPTTVV